ncbi:MAG: hypothetical protein RBT80_06720 [Candidatus Vecturithrix sp.]|jgi:hypothetical protein|nr:hypothetical protein [Candidatus Vecturithrix sp.]
MKKTIVVQGWMVAVSVVVLLFGGIYLTIGTGHWATDRKAEPIKLQSGDYDPADIRGSYTFTEVENFFGVPAALLFEAFGIPKEKRTDTFQIKEMEELFKPVFLGGTQIEVGTDLVRVFTSLYTGLPYQSDETTHLPEGLVKSLIQEQKLSEDQQAYWETHTFPLILAGTAPAQETQAAASTEQLHEQPQAASSPAAESAAVDIKGRTTMSELLDFGLTKEQFKDLTGIEMPGAAIKMKDFVDANGLDMETIKAKILEVLVPPETIQSPAAGAVPATEGEISVTSPQIEIMGSTTLGALLDLGLTKEQFEEIAGAAMPEDLAMKLKDFAEANGLEIETFKTQLLDALQQL